MKYIDADRLRAELEKRLKNVHDYMNGAGMKYKGPKYFKAQGKESAYDALLNIIDSLQQEQPVEGLLEEVDRFWANEFKYHVNSLPTISVVQRIARHFAEWGAEHLKK